MSDRKPIKLRQAADNFPQVKVRGQARAPLDDLYHYFMTRRWSEFFAIVGLIYVGANALFALLYWAVPGSIANASGTYEEAFFFSVQTMATIGYGGMAPQGRFANLLVTFEAIVGMLGVALVTGITFAKFARPQAKVLFTRYAVVTPRDGVPHLCFRMANWRHNQVVEAQLKVLVLVTERTAEGEVIRKPIELKLVRDKTAFFRLTWTAMHKIDEQSPFHGGRAGLDRLKRESSVIFVTLSGLDVTMMQTVHASHNYAIDDIVIGARFADVLIDQPDGTRELDYTLFDETIPVPMPEGNSWGQAA